ncbi:hypothetical protein DQ02_03555 [Citrobacter amalonaticus]|uniref:hypothetical protein n=1 Tax=Citrobacter amalonaticus TaxID=35703 RepID=UPI0004D431B5|nr:hypothetical protein DQ02_03555 [Citrobacter amalonaticus]
MQETRTTESKRGISSATQITFSTPVWLILLVLYLGIQFSDISFRLVFVVIALICLTGMVETLRLVKEAGSAVSARK